MNNISLIQLASGYEVEVLTGTPGPAGVAGLPGQDGTGAAYYGQVASQTSQTFSGLSQGVYVPMALTTSTASELVGFEQDGFGLKNVTGETQLVLVIGTADSSTGNNRTTGLRIAVDGVGIPLTVCTATTGTQNFAKLLTQYLVEVPDGKTVTLQIANVSGSQNVTIERSKLVLGTVGREGPKGDTGDQGPPGNIDSSNNTVADIISITQADYDALSPPNATTLYLIVDP